MRSEDLFHFTGLLKDEYDSLDETAKEGEAGKAILRIRDRLIGVHEDFPLYSDERFERVIEKGEHRGHEYLIRTLGDHPCAYVSIDAPSREFDDLDVGPCVNYWSWEWHRFVGMGGRGFWIGWDYGHSGDYCPRLDEDGRKYSVDDLRADCKLVIDEIVRRTEAKPE